MESDGVPKSYIQFISLTFGQQKNILMREVVNNQNNHTTKRKYAKTMIYHSEFKKLTEKLGNLSCV